ncbi:MAG: prolyl oligopeptidase family serine peptidase [Pseudomonadota bacterium]
MTKSLIIALLLGMLVSACGDKTESGNEPAMTNEANLDDPYLWLEEIEGEKALAWVKARNGESLDVLEGEPGFAEYRARAEAILSAKDRIPYVSFIGGQLYNLWRDEDHVRGLWRRTTLVSYESADPVWETVLDLDALAKAEGENWIWGDAQCRGTDHRRCLITLSRGGTDAAVVREFDLRSKAFVADGFMVEEAKTWFAWYDDDTLIIGSDFGPGSQTEAGYPRFLKLWRRGETLAEAPPIFEVPVTAMGATAHSELGHDRADRLLFGLKTFWSSQRVHLKADGAQVAWPLPEDADFKTLLGGYVLALLRSDWSEDGVTYPRGSLVAYAIDPLLADGATVIEQVLIPGARASIQDVMAAQSTLYVSLLDNVTGKLLALRRGPDGWVAMPVDLPENGRLTISATDSQSERAFVNFEGFLTPDSLYLVGDGPVRRVKALAERFDASRLMVEQRQATSKDGTQVPYFLIRPKDMAMDGTTPLWMWSYGGFEIPLTPRYVSPGVQFWLEEGGAYVVANIRGGGEFGPQWHQAALLKNRQRAYDDFAAVASDLIANKITSPRRLGISGRSNGGLLMGVQLTQQPKLYNAVIIGVPLLDMLRYDKLLAGASWIGEYGDPGDAEMRKAILGYSPYQNLRAEADYPEVFIYTSTKDDRVHPGHARKFAARLMAQGHPVLYYENIEGGHAGVANLKQEAYRAALELVYMNRRLR